jgi:hypothetical protein
MDPSVLGHNPGSEYTVDWGTINAPLGASSVPQAYNQSLRIQDPAIADGCGDPDDVVGDMSSGHGW